MFKHLIFRVQEWLLTELFKNDAKYRNALLEKGGTEKHEILETNFG